MKQSKLIQNPQKQVKVIKYIPQITSTSQGSQRLNTISEKTRTHKSKPISTNRQTKEPTSDKKKTFSSATIKKDENEDIPRSLLCNICRELVKEPTCCYQCKTLFCTKCLLNALERKHKCPRCFKIILPDVLKPLDLTEEFENCILPCKYIGCKEKLNLLSFHEHLNTCEFRVIKDNIMLRNIDMFAVKSNEEDLYMKNYNNEILQKEQNFRILADSQKILSTDEEMDKIMKDFYNSKINCEDQKDLATCFMNCNDFINSFAKDLEEMAMKSKETDSQLKVINDNIKSNEEEEEEEEEKKDALEPMNEPQDDYPEVSEGQQEMQEQCDYNEEMNEEEYQDEEEQYEQEQNEVEFGEDHFEKLNKEYDA